MTPIFLSEARQAYATTLRRTVKPLFLHCHAMCHFSVVPSEAGRRWGRRQPPSAEREEPVTKPLTGKCFCGAVHYAVADEFRYAMNCHCSNCRRTTGSAFKPFARIERG